MWIQQWVALPVVYEQQMGELPPDSRPQALDSATTGLARDGNLLNSPYKSLDNNAPFYSQLSAIPQGQLRSDFRSPPHTSTQFQYQDHGSSLMNMNLMAGALPEFASFEDASVNSQSVPRSLSGASTSAVAYQLGQNLQMPAHASGSLPTHPSYGLGFGPTPYQQTYMLSQGPQHGSYPPFATNPPRLPGTTTTQAPYQSYGQASQYMYYPTPYEVQGQFAPGYAAQGSQGHSMYGRRASLTSSGPGADFSHIENGFPGARIAPMNLHGEQGQVGSTYSMPFPSGPGKNIYTR